MRDYPSLGSNVPIRQAPMAELLEMEFYLTPGNFDIPADLQETAACILERVRIEYVARGLGL